MNDLGTAEHMGTSYLWRARKRGQRAHILNLGTGQAYCQAENCSDGKAFDGRGAGIPDGRRLCQNCADLEGRDEASYAEPNLAVLLGERMVEDEPGLFAGTMAPKPERTDLTSPRAEKWKRGKHARPAHRSKGRKPKRSNVKIAKPFDDPLPW